MIKVFSRSAVRKSDAEKISSGTPGKELMRRAAEGIADHITKGGKVAVVCGKGNNGGDGFALALILSERGSDCTVFTLSDVFSPDGEFYYKK